ncbi:hypothetical protein [Virgibacillus dokdonensis]|uniref:Uncharacterized protein n=1 Tax=Virgibacillus dokdonensis TaxID=302167 RepID=A0A2K9J7N5_9BACI|nr:hypothetical protein [Virgibacillus dokdonensis]AUJ26561.1 hypothetical protein A21D_03527 [Virgibacillus dokdonensis]
MRKVLIIAAFAVLVVALIISILYGVGKGVVLGEDKVTYDELQKKIEDKERELESISTELKENEDYYNELQQIEEEREELMQTVVDYKVEITSLENEIEDKENKLNKIEGKIVKTVDKPIKLEAGYFYFGEDIDPGRYKIEVPKGTNGNVHVKSEDGDLIVSKNIGGNSQYSVDSYTFHASSGDEIEASVPLLLYPVGE